VTAPFGQTRPRRVEDFWSYLERLGNGVIPFRKVLIAGPLATALVSVTAAYGVRETDSSVLADATGAAFAVTLPTAAGVKGRIYTVKRMNAGANNVTIACTGGQTIDGAATVVLAAQYDRATVQSTGANWVRID
jgi:hypothetical protein